jgi:hypothetical protein
MNHTQDIGEYKGYKMTVFASVSYQCTALGLRGYRGELELKRAITREINKRAKKQANKGK